MYEKWRWEKKDKKKNGWGHPEIRGSRDQHRHHVTLAWREIIHAAAFLFCFSDYNNSNSSNNNNKKKE